MILPQLLRRATCAAGFVSLAEPALAQPMAGTLPQDENHEINVTPFIDVMLVLLIIFMVAAPLATVDVKVDLPASTAQSQPKPDKQVFLSIKADGQMVLGEQPVTHDSLAAALLASTNGDHEQRVFLRADKSVTYETIMDAMNDLRGAGYLKVALVGTEKAPRTQGVRLTP